MAGAGIFADNDRADFDPPRWIGLRVGASEELLQLPGHAAELFFLDYISKRAGEKVFGEALWRLASLALAPEAAELANVHRRDPGEFRLKIDPADFLAGCFFDMAARIRQAAFAARSDLMRYTDPLPSSFM